MFQRCPKIVITATPSACQAPTLAFRVGDTKEDKGSTAGYLFLLSDFFLWFGNDLLLLGEDHLDVAGGAHVGVDATVRSVGAPTHFGSLVDLDVLDHQRIHVKALGGEGKER